MRHKSQMFKPIKKAKVYEEIVAKIKDMIEKGRFKSGDQLPVERELAEVFRVSRSSVREALRSLESQGFIESRQGDGTYIASQPVESLVRPLASVIFTEKDDQMELFEMRRMIEPDLAYLAAERATEEEIDMLEKVLVLQEEQIDRGGLRNGRGQEFPLHNGEGGEKQGPPAHHRQHHGPPRGEPRAVPPGGGKTPEIHFAPQGSARGDPCQGTGTGREMHARALDGYRD